MGVWEKRSECDQQKSSYVSRALVVQFCLTNQIELSSCRGICLKNNFIGGKIIEERFFHKIDLLP